MPARIRSRRTSCPSIPVDEFHSFSLQVRAAVFMTANAMGSSYTGWANDATLGVAGPIIVDGAKRDR